jgi:hypothetical protein
LGEDAETIYYSDKIENALTGVIRGFQGIAKEWPANTTPVARQFTAYDHDSFIENINRVNENVTLAMQSIGKGQTVYIPKVTYRQPVNYHERLPIIIERTGMAAFTISDNDVLLVGGCNKYGRADRMTLLLRMPSGRLERLSPMPTPRMNAGISFDRDTGNVYVAGGRDAKGLVVGDVEVYNITTNTWSALPGLSVPREGCRTVIQNRKLYCIGGRNTNTVDVYTFVTKTWSMLPGMAAPRFLFGAASFGSHIMCMGGENPRGMSRTNDVYSPKTNSWASNYDMYEGQSNISIAMFNGVQCCLGGLDGRTFLYIPVNDRWMEHASMDTGTGTAVVTRSDGVYAFGGRESDGSIKSPIVKIIPGRMVLSPVDEGDAVWNTSELYTDTQRIKPFTVNRITHDGMLYADADHAFGWIKKGGI